MLYFQFFISGVGSPTPPTPTVEDTRGSGEHYRPAIQFRRVRARGLEPLDLRLSVQPTRGRATQAPRPQPGKPRVIPHVPVWTVCKPKAMLRAVALPQRLDGPAWSIPGAVLPSCRVVAGRLKRLDIGIAKLRRSRLAKLEEAALMASGFDDPATTLMALHAVIDRPRSWADAEIRLRQ